MFRGIYPMQFAFFDAAGELDKAAMRRQAEGCIAAGVDGLAVLGLGTEVNKLTLSERRQVLEGAAEAAAGKVALSVTVAEPSIAAQTEFARYAVELGADWIVLQPPPVRSASESELIRFFGKVADAVDAPIGIQNAPEYTGIGLSAEGIATLARNHANFRVLKGEGPVIGIRKIIEETNGQLAVFNGRGGLELTDNLRAGCAGMVPGAESCDVQKRIFDLVTSPRAEDQAEGEALYRSLLPLVVFLMQSLDNFLVYGKLLAALRYGIESLNPRTPSFAPNPFGLACLTRAAEHLWPDLEFDRLAAICSTQASSTAPVTRS
ncbi:dihydrodipicolinate synthase family protein [Arvimicrobium flavum]|uniref:dihydrodipicolinate synthase family protein n=1 Tax=Arvimicrobium flavum TaxID=3393320 RepID=UPI00237A6193|nr:dihydrodipicolinate synthase family protein [Mesorhizobium shangrilense]